MMSANVQGIQFAHSEVVITVSDGAGGKLNVDLSHPDPEITWREFGRPLHIVGEAIGQLAQEFSLKVQEFHLRGHWLCYSASPAVRIDIVAVSTDERTSIAVRITPEDPEVVNEHVNGQYPFLSAVKWVLLFAKHSLVSYLLFLVSIPIVVIGMIFLPENLGGILFFVVLGAFAYALDRRRRRIVIVWSPAWRSRFWQALSNRLEKLTPM